MHGMESIDRTVMAGSCSNFDWQSPPPLTLDTNFSTPYSPDNDLDLASFSAGSMPSIAITECEPTPFCASPSSPVPSFPSDSSTRPSSPDQLPTSTPKPNLAPPSRAGTFSPPMAPHNAPSWEFMASSSQLRPDPQRPNLSRRTSASSLSHESEDDGESDVDMLPLAPVPHLPRPGLFSAHAESPPPGMSRSSFTDRSRAMTTTPFPSRFEAETLTAEFVQHLESLEYKAYAVSPSVFAKFCESVYPDPAQKPAPAPADAVTSVQMARFHVFMAMAIGMKVRIRDNPEPTNSLLDTCYELAMQQTSSVTFWAEKGGVEAAQLLSLFASIRKEAHFEPRPLHSSPTW